MDKFKIGDKVNFVVERSLLSGVITKFYKNTYNEEECSIKTEIKTFPHILLQRVSKINDEEDLIKKIADLEAKLAESDRELKLAQKLHTELFLSYEKLKDNSEQLKQQLAEERKKVVQEIKEQILKHFKVKSEKEYEEALSLLDALFTADVVFEILDQIERGE